jgi:hypothetical protein
VFTVEGKLDGQKYRAEVGGELPDWGAVSGSGNVMELLVRGEGSDWAATPTGPFGELDCSEPASVLGALFAWTRVTRVTGDVPDILGSKPVPGTVY